MSLLWYDSSSSSDSSSDFEDYAEKPESNQQSSNISVTFNLPPPKVHSSVPPPPSPIAVLPPEIAKQVLDSHDSKDEIIDVDTEKLKTENQDIAKKNMIIRDKAQFNGIGYDRNKSQLTYLAQVDLNSRQTFEKQMGQATRAKVFSSKMYGW